MKKLAFTFAVLFAAVCFGQTKEEVKETSPIPPSDMVVKEETYTVVEQMPVLADCKKENQEESQACTQQMISKHIATEVKYPETAREAEKQGTVYVSFVIKSDGSIADVKVLRGVKDAPEIDAEAVRAVKTLGNFEWIPGTQRGKAVSVAYNLPVRFALN